MFRSLLLKLGLVFIFLFFTTKISAADYQVGAYYFGMFSPQDTGIIQKTLATYGRANDWWGGVRDFHGDPDYSPPVSINTQGWPESFPHLKPAIGYYDNSQTATLEKHINQAVSHGLTYFNFYWYWDAVKKQEYLDGGLKTFLSASNHQKMKFMLSLCAHPWDNLGINANDSPSTVEILINYFKKNNYLKTADGRPIIFFLDHRGIKDGSLASLQDYVALLKQETKNSLGVYPFILGNVEIGNTTQAVNLDGLSCGTLLGLSFDNSEDYVGDFSKYNNSLISTLDSHKSKSFLSCFITDFNEKPRTVLALPKSSIRYLGNWSFTEMSRGLQKLKSYLDTNPFPLSNYLTLYSWNEWHEGGHVLEPNTNENDRVLDEVARIFQLPTFGDNQCQTYGTGENCNLPVTPTLPPNTQGSLDSADCSRIQGWAKDLNSDQPLNIHFYQNAPHDQGGKLISSALANIQRTDLPFTDKNHGFQLQTPPLAKTGQNVSLYAYAIDSYGNPLLPNSPKNINCPLTKTDFLSLLPHYLQKYLPGEIDNNNLLNGLDLATFLNRL